MGNETKQSKRQEIVSRVVDELSQPPAWQGHEHIGCFDNVILPSRRKVLECVEELRAVLFPEFFGEGDSSTGLDKNLTIANLDRVLNTMQTEISHALRNVEGRTFEGGREFAGSDDAEAITDALLAAIPEIKRKLLLDARASYEWDPAVVIPETPIYCYPNMFVMTAYRIAHELYQLGVPFIPRIISEQAHSQTGIDINPGAQLGEGIFIDHGTGVVIGQTCILGDRVRLYQGVTLGVKSFELDEKTGRPTKLVPRHPIIEHDTVIYAEACILGRITIGHHSVIGANVFITSSLPPYSKIFQPSMRVGDVKKAARERAKQIEGQQPTEG